MINRHYLDQLNIDMQRLPSLEEHDLIEVERAAIDELARQAGDAAYSLEIFGHDLAQGDATEEQLARIAEKLGVETDEALAKAYMVYAAAFIAEARRRQEA